MAARSARRLAGGILLLLVCAPGLASAQYFGRNKVQYRTFQFEVLKTDHFDFYYYPEEAEAAGIASRMAERWYTRLSQFFGHELRGRQALILYAVSAHFRQTNAVEGLIGEGTGGVTEALKRRIVLPMSGSLADTDHVIGHELVHAFQFDITGTDPRDTGGQAPGILDYPLWFVEGMAEYLSLGPVDAQTAMWLRDAALREKLPDVKDLDDWKYFPYRWGHAFWAYVGAKYGDRTVASLIRSAANPRFDLAGLARQLGTDPATLSADWHQAIIAAARTVAEDTSTLESEPRLTIPVQAESGRFNVGPRISPDGKQMAFFSERDRFSVDLYLADAATGKIERRLVRSATDPHFDSLEFLNSAGAWSPDGRRFVITAVRAGKPVLAFIDPDSGRIDRERPLPGLDDALNPAFAPDGRSIVLSGNHGGLIDLYRVPVDPGPLDQLTHDPFADLEPVFTPDGTSLVFVTERYSIDLATLVPGPLRLARLDLATREVTPIPGFLRGKHLSPQVSADGRMVTFVADPDGVSNLYRMPIEGGPIERLSSFVTGVAGITSSSPALSMSADGGRLAFSVFEDNGHAIYTLDRTRIVAEVAPLADGHGALLAGRLRPGGEVFTLLSDARRGLPPAGGPAGAQPYERRLSLDVIGQPTVTAGVSGVGTYVGGSVSAYFTDMLGDRALGLAAQVGGALADLGGQAVYVSRKHRWNWAAAVEQLPYRVGYLTFDENAAANEVRLAEVIERQTSRGAFAVTAFPFNSATRVEFSGGAHQLTFTRQTRTAVYDATAGNLIDRTDETTRLADPLYVAESSVALVHDTSYFGATGPLYGARSRIELGQSLGSLHYSSLLVDVRRYFMPKRPFTFAFRAAHYGRYGSGSEDPRLIGLYAGYPEFVHGYGVGSFTASDCTGAGDGRGECAVFDSLIGSRILVANAEVRAPLLGLFTGNLDYGRIPIDLAAFFDAGVAWTRTNRPAFAGGTRDLVRSAGVAARINAFGLFVLEIAASRPFDRVTRGWQWQIGIRQGF
jgi:Tol biopolymer transport system component